MRLVVYGFFKVCLLLLLGVVGCCFRGEWDVGWRGGGGELWAGFLVLVFCCFRLSISAEGILFRFHFLAKCCFWISLLQLLVIFLYSRFLEQSPTIYSSIHYQAT